MLQLKYFTQNDRVCLFVLRQRKGFQFCAKVFQEFILQLKKIV